MERIINFRALAEGLFNKDGRCLKKNTILRSGVLARASETDQNVLKAYGVKTIYDLRSESEYKQLPPLGADNFTTKHYHVLDDMDPSVAAEFASKNAVDLLAFMDQMYADDFAGKDPFNDVISDVLSRSGEGFLFHCTAGRDRTGILAAIIMMILDFDIEMVLEEYLRYDESGTEQLAQMTLMTMKQHGVDGDIEALRALFKPAKSNIEAFLSVIMNRFESLDEYLIQVYGVDDVVKRQFQGLYLS